MRAWLLVVALAGCDSGKKPDRCTTFVDKSMSVMQPELEARGRKVEPFKAELMETCAKDEPLVACVLRAADRQAIGQCFKQAANAKVTDVQPQLDKIRDQLKAEFQAGSGTTGSATGTGSDAWKDIESQFAEPSQPTKKD